MTLPIERKNAVNYTRRFLLDLSNPRITPRIPKTIRDQARGLLKHYPLEIEMDEAGLQAPKIFGDEL